MNPAPYKNPAPQSGAGFFLPVVEPVSQQFAHVSVAVLLLTEQSFFR